ncbi:MAG: ABC transporter ATP-binding protein [Deltaproteobacteria bacterium]|nr:ABC transporter ATP-binding protein [Deltaproteobacteria bacterium]
MSDAIVIEEVSKRYRLGASAPADTLREAITRFVRARLPGRRPAPEMPSAVARDRREIWALRDVSFSVARGEVVGLIGRNGAGKSTMLKILAHIIEPTSGRARIRGRCASLLEIGTGFHPDLTGRENVYLSGAILGMRRREIDRKFDEIVAFSEIERFLDTPVKHYSSGMYVRLAFAVAAHLETEILLVDEVLAVGDAAFQRKCLGAMSPGANKGRTVLFVSHNMDAIRSRCGQVHCFDRGQLVFSGPAAEGVDYYLKTSDLPAPVTAISLADNPAAQCEGLRLLDITLRNPAHPAVGPCTGDPLSIWLRYRSTRAFASPGFSFAISDMRGIELIRLTTLPISGFPIEGLHPAGAVELFLDELPLVAGPYALSFAFVRVNVAVVFALPNVLQFEVAPSDVYKSGFKPDQSRGRIVVRHHWSHAPEADPI